MRKLSQKSVLLFAAAMALCAFAMPSIASASSWGPVGTEHRLDGNFGFLSDALATSSMCSRAQLTGDVASAAALEITSASFTGCTISGPFFGTCTMTWTSTNLPWTATAVTTSNIQIHGIDIDVVFDNHPDSSACSVVGFPFRITGTLTGARWTGNATHEMDVIPGATGLVFHFGILGNNLPLTSTGTLVDTQGLTVN